LGGRILVVDDATFMRMMLKDILTKGNYEVVGEAQTGLEAIKKYKELRPDLVTLDITMPDMDGLSAAREIISIDPNAKIIMCSAMGQQHMVIEALKSGVKDFIIKPFQQERVIEAIKKIIG
jgi:two-component system chemotaxis response regulator CheY